MKVSSLLFDFPHMRIGPITLTPERVIVELQATNRKVTCPVCGWHTRRVQSRYTRTLQDVPVRGKPLRLLLQARGFFCDHPTCSRKIFAERFPDLATTYSRQTTRLTQALSSLGFALGGKAGERVCRPLGMPCSHDTLLRLLRSSSCAPESAVRVLGVDNWCATRSRMCSCKSSRKEDFTWGSAPCRALAESSAPGTM